MCEEELDDFEDKGEGEDGETDSEAEESSLEVVREIESQEAADLAKSSASATESTLSEASHQAVIASSGMSRIISESSSNSEMEFDDAGSEAESETESESAEETQSDTESEHERLAEDQKTVMVLRIKFWAMIGIPSLSLAGILTGLVYNLVKKGEDSLPPAVSDELKELLKKKVKEWQSMGLGPLFAKIETYVKGFELGPQAQAYFMSQIKVIVPQPAGLAKWAPAEFNEKVNALVENYATALPPRSLSLYSLVVTMTRKDENDPTLTRPVTVHEAADLCDNALCQIIKLRDSAK